MLNAIVQFSLKHYRAVIILAFLALAASFWLLRSASYDVFPEFAPPQVMIQTEAPGFSAEQVENLVTKVVEQAVNGATGITSIQSSSIQGLSAVTVFFDDNSNIFLDRQAIAERIQAIATQLPSGVASPLLTPLTSTTNNILGVGFTSNTMDLADLRRWLEAVVKPQILSVAGVAEAEIYGGQVKQVEIQVKPDALLKYNLTFDDVAVAARRIMGVRGAGVIDTATQRIAVQTNANINDLAAIKSLPLVRGAAENIDLAITLGDVANVSYGIKTAFNTATIMGQKGVLLLVTSQYQTNSLKVTQAVEQVLARLAPQIKAAHIDMTGGLIRPASFVESSVASVMAAIYIGAALVVILLILFLANWRAAFISAISIPFSLVMAALVLQLFNQSLNTMTLGGLAIAVGLVVDDAIIDIENMLRRLQHNTNKLSKFKVLLQASLEVRAPVVFATLAVLILASPIIFLPGVAGNLFAPMGYAYAIATFFSLLVALTITPALAMCFLQEQHTQPSKIVVRLRYSYANFLQAIYPRRYLVYISSAVILMLALVIGKNFNVGFMPSLREGHFIVHMELEPGSSFDKADALGAEVTKSLLKLGFVDKVVLQMGRTEGGIDIFGPHQGEFNVSLKVDKNLSEDAAQAKIWQVLKKFPDAEFEVETFLTERVNEVLSGHTAQVTINLYSEDLATLNTASENVINLLKANNSLRNVKLEALEGAPMLDIKLNAKALDEEGLLPIDVLETVRMAYQGEVVGQIYDHTPPTDITVILPPTYRQNTHDIASLMVRTAVGNYLPLSDLATISLQQGRYEIQRDAGQRTRTITLSLKNNASVTQTLQTLEQTLENPKNLGPAVSFKMESAFEKANESQHHLVLLALISIVIVLVLLSFVLSSWQELCLVAILLPLSLSGGVFVLAMRGTQLNIGSMIGFITLLGIALRNAVLLLAHYRHMIQHEAVVWSQAMAIQGAVERLLPILMTAVITACGMLPLALTAGASGHEIDGPMAQVILGGLCTATFFSLILIPILSVGKKI